ncbi:MAG: twin-arginine translocase TatA/TatE family subunit [Gammaproteobacteria bacterium]
MGFGIKELVIILIIVVLVFGTKKIRHIGGDVGGWIRDFRKAMRDDSASEKDDEPRPETNRVIEGETRSEKEHVQ